VVRFLLERGVLDRAEFAPRNAAMDAGLPPPHRQRAGLLQLLLGTLAGRPPAEWQTLQHDFLMTAVVPRIPHAARALVDRHLLPAIWSCYDGDEPLHHTSHGAAPRDRAPDRDRMRDRCEGRFTGRPTAH